MIMPRVGEVMRGGIILILAGVLAGCIMLPRVTLFNNTGAPLVLYFAKGEDGVRKVKLWPGQSRTFRYPEAGISDGACMYRYDYPDWSYNSPDWDLRYGYPIKVQVEPDFSLHILPGSARKVRSVEGLEIYHQLGFPLRPTKKTCPAP